MSENPSTHQSGGGGASRSAAGPVSAEAQFAVVMRSLQIGGRQEAGLEVGQDAALPHSKFIIIPKNWPTNIKFAKARYDEADPQKPPTPGEVVAVPIDKCIYQWKGKFYTEGVEAAANEEEAKAYEIIATEGQNYSDDCINRFIRLNWKRTGGDSEAQRVLGCSLRFWSVALGYVVTSHITEYEFESPDDNTETDNINTADITAAQVTQTREYIYATSAANAAATACVGRALTYRATNHCTGGPIAQGAARRVIQTVGATLMWNKDDKPGQRSATTFWYGNTHFSCVHRVLANFFPDRAENWAKFYPAYGFSNPANPLTSFKARGDKKSGVAGTAWLTDTFQALAMLTGQHLTILVDGITERQAYINTLRHIWENGMKCGVAAIWWCAGSPRAFGITAAPIDQKSPSTIRIVADLARAIKYFLKTKTLERAPAIRAICDQYPDRKREDMWENLNRSRSATNYHNPLVQAFVSRSLAKIDVAASMDFVNAAGATRTTRVDTYNAMMAEITQLCEAPAYVPIELPQGEEFDNVVATARTLATQAMVSSVAEVPDLGAAQDEQEEEQ